MNTAEIKQTIEGMNEDERFFAAAYLGVLIRRNDPEYRETLRQRMNRVAAGKKVSLGEARHAPAAFEAKEL